MSLEVKIPKILDMVDDDVMIETVKSGKFIIIAIPITDILVEKQTEKVDVVKSSQLGFEVPEI